MILWYNHTAEMTLKLNLRGSNSLKVSAIRNKKS